MKSKILNITLNNQKYQIHSWTKGSESNAPVVLLHGFPTSSTDYELVSELLEKDFYLVAFDFLGFGRSPKSQLPKLSIHLQADLVVAVMRAYQLSNPFLIAHDYGLTVAQELLARRESFKKVILLNGGAYAHLHRPLMIQKLLRNFLLGPVVSRLGSKKIFLKNLRKILSRPVADELLQEAWNEVTYNGGNKIFHHLIHYIGDRQEYASRWANALSTNQDHLAFIWGQLDPISGAHMLEHLMQNLPRAKFYPLADTGHYPQWEAPAEVARLVQKEFLP